MDLQDWLIFLHLLGAFFAVTALTALWVLVFATRPAAPLLEGPEAGKFGRVAGPLVGSGMGIALVFGVWLVLSGDEYSFTDAWIILAILLWVVGAAVGPISGKLFTSGDATKRGKAIALQLLNSAAVVGILVLMIWKPGA